ncbi:hypothetical protein DFH28DRAFT_1118948 [Melampsora americana]|nr:hypothetical protein DFH28DRAFT_1118948 [Melampsora americana]
MFPMLGPPRPTRFKKNKPGDQKIPKKKTVRLVDPPSTPTTSLESPFPSTSTPVPVSAPEPPTPSSLPITSPSFKLLSYSPRPKFTPSTCPIDSSPKAIQKSRASSKPTQPKPVDIVISFITRGPPDRPRGQGAEILFYKPNSHLLTPPPPSCLRKAPKQIPDVWTFLFIDASSTSPTFLGPSQAQPEAQLTTSQLSERSINRHLPSLDCSVDLRLSFCEVGWAERALLVADQVSTGGTFFSIAGLFLSSDGSILCSNLHAAIENHLVATALASVAFPVALNVGYEEIAQEEGSNRPDLVSLRALETLYLSIQAGYARDGFRFYPQTSSEELRTEVDRERAFKCRVWAYWTNVVCWHLVRAKPSCQVSVAYSMNKVLASVKPAVLDDKLNLEDMEKLIAQSIGREADRCREATDKLVNHAQAELLFGDMNIFNDPSKHLLGRNLHVFTLGSSSATYSLLSSLVSHVIRTQTWKRVGAPERVETLKVTISESQPFDEGVILASKLVELAVPPGTKLPKKVFKPPTSQRAQSVAKKPISIKSKKSSVLSSDDLELNLEQLYLHSDHAKTVAGGFGGGGEGIGGRSDFLPSKIESEGNEAIKDRLPDLLAQMAKDRKKSEEEKKLGVEIELVTDAGFRSALMRSTGSLPVLVLAADRVLPNGDSVCKLGALSAAYTAKALGAPVLILVRLDRIHPSHMPNRPTLSEKTAKVTKEAMLNSWKTMLKAEAIDKLNVEFGNVDAWESIGSELVSGYVTELGVLGIDRVKQMSQTLSKLDKLIWNDGDEEDEEKEE